jgi:phospholipid/cholesterol/gamma-HCH transport system substrate-binding protein
MAKQANRMMIGGFVILAIIILAASLVIFGSGKFFQKTQTFVLYFEGSVMGLNEGSPVMFRGVPIGSVTKIILKADVATGQILIPVFIEIEPDKFQVYGGPRNPQKNIPRLIDKGLRAVLVTQSFITGQLAIELDFEPGTPLVLKHLSKEYIEIPTIPSTTQKLMDALSKLDLKAIEHNLDSALEGISKLANDPNLLAAIKGMKDTLQSAHKLLAKADKKIDPLTKNANKTLTGYRVLANTLDSRVKELSASLKKTLSNADGTLSGLDKTMTKFRGVVSPNSPLVFDLENALQQVSRMSEALRELADYLEEHPSSVIRGKKKNGGNK